MTLYNIDNFSPFIKLCRRFEELGISDTIIAGGAIRDTWFQNRMSDIDVFVHYNERTKYLMYSNNKLNYNFIKSLFGGAAIQHDDNSTEDGSVYLFAGDTATNKNYYNDDLIFSVDNVVTKSSSYIFQIIAVKQKPEHYVYNHFDLGICKCFCDNRKLRLTNDFLNDAKNKTITLKTSVLTKHQIDFIKRYHLLKVQSKYPHFKIVEEI